MSEFGVQTKGTQKTRSLREIHSTLAEPLPFGLEIQLDIVTSSTVVSNTPEKNAGPLTATVVSNSPRKKTRVLSLQQEPRVPPKKRCVRWLAYTKTHFVMAFCLSLSVSVCVCLSLSVYLSV